MAFGREICCNLDSAESREWLVTNGIGGYASGTIAGLLTRRYHGLLVAALKPPLGRTLILAKLDETAVYDDRAYPLYTNRWADATMAPHGYNYIESFHLEGTTPVWRFALADAILEKRIWMQQGANTTYIQYRLHRASQPIALAVKALINYRDYHHTTRAGDWQMSLETLERGVCVTAYPESAPLYLLTDAEAEAKFRVSAPLYNWHYGFDLAAEKRRGLDCCEDHLHAATFHMTIAPGSSLTLIASTEKNTELNGGTALEVRRAADRELLQNWSKVSDSPDWINHLVLAADQFIVSRPLPEEPAGKTIIAGYPWFSDWGRDTTIALPGLTICTGRWSIARSILRTFARYIDRGMLPNRFPDAGGAPEYNTADATLWYFEAIRAYIDATGDDELLSELWPTLCEIIDWHIQGTRYKIRLDPDDGLIYAGEKGVQLTWMDAKIGDWVVTPRIGKPIELSALWYNAIQAMASFARKLGKPHNEYQQLGDRTAAGFPRFWNASTGYCYDVLDGPDGHDSFPAAQPDIRRIPAPRLDSSSLGQLLVSGDAPGNPLYTVTDAHPAARRGGRLRSTASDFCRPPQPLAAAPAVSRRIRRRPIAARQRLPPGHSLGLADWPVCLGALARIQKPSTSERIPRTDGTSYKGRRSWQSGRNF
jgi:predicted glycogen debranching enzyme